MKILLVKGFPLLSSVGVLARGLKQRGHDIHVLVPAEHRDGDAMRLAGIPTHTLPMRAPGVTGVLHAATTLRSLGRLLREHHFDVIHLNLAQARLYGRIGSRLGGRPVVVSSIRGLEDRYERWCNRLDDATVAVSATVKGFLLARGIPAARIETIANGVDLEALDAVPHDPCYLHRELGVAPETRLVGMVAYFRQHAQKGHQVLLDAAKLVAACFDDVAFVLVGSSLSCDGYTREFFERYAARLGIARRVHFVGERHDVPALMSSFYAHVLPSYREGCPMVVLEAMARGTPNVASDIPSIREIIDHGRDGILFETGNHVALARALETLLVDPAAARALGARGRKRIETAYRASDMTVQYERLFSRLVDSRRPVAAAGVR